MDRSSWAYWKALGEDKEAYKAKKMELAALVKEKIEKTWPEYRGKLTLSTLGLLAPTSGTATRTTDTTRPASSQKRRA